jgi:hypothetical protein
MFEADKQKNLAQKAFNASDPFGKYRGVYGDQLLALMANPESVKDLPGYQFQFDQGAEAVQRKLASKGYGGSGNMGIALTEYGQNFASSYFDREATRLATLAGANIAPNFGAALSGYGLGINTASDSLASLGYGSVYAGGSSQGTPGGGGSRPNSAGGEAAAVGKTISAGGNLLAGLGAKNTGSAVSNVGGLVSGISKGGVGGYAQAATSGAKLGLMATGGSVASRVGATGPDPSGIGYAVPTAGTGGVNVDKAIGTAGDLASIYTGIDQGGVGGYSQAVAGAADLAGYDVPYLGYVDAASKVVKGDVGGGGYSAMITAAGPIAAIGAAAANLANKSLTGHGDERRNQGTWMAAFPDTQIWRLSPRMGATVTVLPGGKVISTEDFDRLSGTWFGANFAPDGNQADWQKQYEEAVNSIQASSSYYFKDGTLYSTKTNQPIKGAFKQTGG